MATQQIKRRTTGSSAPPPSLKAGELAYDALGDILYIGKGDDGSGNATSVQPIGGGGAVMLLLSDQAVAGIKTFNASPLVPTKATNDNTQAVASTAFVQAVAALRLALSGGTLTGALTLAGDPTAALHAASKQYVDNLIQGFNPKASVRAASTGNLTLSGTQTVDDVALTAGMRVLVKDQTTASQNGIYVVAAGAWSRAADADAWSELVSLFVLVEQGTVNGDVGFVSTADQGGTIGSTAVPFVKFGTLAGLAPLLSPAFTGVPTAPTAAAGTNTTQLATTAFVQAAVSAAQAGGASTDGGTY